jgi:hypothetical protein
VLRRAGAHVTLAAAAGDAAAADADAAGGGAGAPVVTCAWSVRFAVDARLSDLFGAEAPPPFQIFVVVAGCDDPDDHCELRVDEPARAIPARPREAERRDRSRRTDHNILPLP